MYGIELDVKLSCRYCSDSIKFKIYDYFIMTAQIGKIFSYKIDSENPFWSP